MRFHLTTMLEASLIPATCESLVVPSVNVCYKAYTS